MVVAFRMVGWSDTSTKSGGLVAGASEWVLPTWALPTEALTTVDAGVVTTADDASSEVVVAPTRTSPLLVPQPMEAWLAIWRLSHTGFLSEGARPARGLTARQAAALKSSSPRALRVEHAHPRFWWMSEQTRAT